MIAVHEGGHALVAMLDENCDPVHKVSIIPRGMALGVTQTVPTEDRNIVLRRQLLATITHARGGRAAEEVVFGHFSTGAADDLKRATQVAREMVCSFGMSEKLGPMALGNGGGEIFLGRDITHLREHSEEKARQIDEEVLKLLAESYARAKDRIIDKRDVLDRIAEALLERETLGASDLKLLLEGRELPPLPLPETVPVAQTGSEPEGGKVKTPLPERPIPDPEPIPG